MAGRASGRYLGELASPEVSSRVGDASILCLPLGAIEQHGPHLPLDTDVVVAEGVTSRIIARWGDEFDLWQLPTIPIGLSREHDWAPGTLSLSIGSFVGLLRDLVRETLRALPTRNLAFINGHGGNRGILENLVRELQADFAVNTCVIHPFDLAPVAAAPKTPDVHGGRDETSLMLALAPERVRLELLPPPDESIERSAIEALISDRGTTWPWRSDDPRIARNGIIGDARAATTELGVAILENIVTESRRVFLQLRENQRLMTQRILPW